MFASHLIGINILYIWETQKQNSSNPVHKWAEDLNRHFSKEEMQICNKHMKRCSTPLITQEKQIKTTVRYHLISNRMTIIKNSKTPEHSNLGENMEKLELLCTVGGNVKCCSHFRK